MPSVIKKYPNGKPKKATKRQIAIVATTDIENGLFINKTKRKFYSPAVSEKVNVVPIPISLSTLIDF